MPFEKAILIRSLAMWGGFAIFLVLELLAPYRLSTVSKSRRWVTNVSLTIFNGVALNLVFGAAILGATAYVTANHTGLLYSVNLPPWARAIAVVAFMDFMLYVWHLLNHEMPTLWRFHRVHHSDLNMDVSTATRFHIGELTISAAIKIGLIFFLDVRFAELVVFETLLVMTAQFQHSVIRVPQWFERFYWMLFVPPSMHRIHHSVVIRERDTNYGTIFSTWDRVLGTLLTKVEQDRIKIGLGAYRDPTALRLGRILVMPFTRLVR
jgi:sterol desaturase/sphingolipid hydroxylase (fatty acid hydroxylase superfamily)